MAYFNILSQHLPEGNEKNHKKSLDNQPLGHELNLGPPEYEEYFELKCAIW
jgi:hypothetical protein